MGMVVGRYPAERWTESASGGEEELSAACYRISWLTPHLQIFLVNIICNNLNLSLDLLFRNKYLLKNWVLNCTVKL